MTLGIGVMCDKGETLVLASEGRITYGETPIVPNEKGLKQFYLKPHKVLVCVAGKLSHGQGIYSQFHHTIDQLEEQGDLPQEVFMRLLDSARARELKRIADWTLKTKVGFSLHEWHTGTVKGVRMNRLIVECGKTIYENTRLPVEMIVAGFSGGYGVFFKAIRERLSEEETHPGVFAIGSGQLAAMQQLNKRGQNSHISLGRTLLHIYEAMLLAQSKSVGPPPEFASIIRKDVPQILVYPLRSLETWRKAYESRASTASLDETPITGVEVMNRLRYLREADVDNE